MRFLRFVVLAFAGVAVVLALAVLVSAATDRPSKTIHSDVTIEARPETVWRILTDFEGYAGWNPLITEAEGDARVGARVSVHLEPPGGDAEDLSSEITVLRPNRKLAWMSREVLPGVSDREYEVIIDSLGDERVRVVIHKRFEGLLIPFTSTSEEQVGLDLMAEALKRRAESDPGE